ncbi:alkaline phosphatase [Sphingobacterium pedocola]|uniref:Alkaline phosphatase n=1 Tax=Sphingobacterium pedocola TaxID=2082722 RepID=A0ABR9T2M8_9SPHI|nr:alkaline phosphatase [Sphingobacterium pedocola]MBE8719608.1 alkaline phosphatase [Sphingobacterium pedocola]
MKKILLSKFVGAALLFATPTFAQIRPTAYLQNLHSHNDYTRNHPFELAYGLGFGSIEVDLFLQDGELYVAHEQQEITTANTFDRLYLQPILKAFADSKEGYLYPEGGQLQLLIDPKADGKGILEALLKKIEPHRQLFDSKNNPKAVKLLISGDRPAPEDFHRYDEVFFFDGELQRHYTASQLARVGLFSAPFPKYSEWNGLGRLTDGDYRRVKSAVDSVHNLGKKFRFWAAPDTKTTWYEWMKMGVDYINTDQPMAAAQFVQAYPKNSHTNADFYSPYVPQREKSTSSVHPKNVILLISDGAGLSQLWAAAMANRGQLNVLNMPYTGYLVTSSTDNYHTDSAAGGSALATGVKTRNRYIGVDTMGNRVSNIPDQIAKAGMVSGIVSNDRITGATPSSFYAHVSERNRTDSIAAQLVDSKLSLMVGGFHSIFAEADSTLLSGLKAKGVEIMLDAEHIADSKSERLLVFAQDKVDREWDKLKKDQDDTKTDYRLIEHTFAPSVQFLKQRAADNGFFLMVEGAKIDGGGHSNSLPFTIAEYLSFDRMVGEALRYADADGETLVLVTSDHETGGLVLLDAEKDKGNVLGNFATTDHTGIPVPLMAYGPGADLFQGFLDNADIAKLIYRVLNLPTK